MSVKLSLTPSWTSELPRNIECPPRSLTLVSLATRVLVDRFENSSATVLSLSVLLILAAPVAGYLQDALKEADLLMTLVIWSGVRSASERSDGGLGEDELLDDEGGGAEAYARTSVEGSRREAERESIVL